jgi:hypothetical protein
MVNTHFLTLLISGGPTTGIHLLSSKSVKDSQKESTLFMSMVVKAAAMVPLM